MSSSPSSAPTERNTRPRGVLPDSAAEASALKASFSVVAANVTINNSNTQFSFSASGYQDDSSIRTAGAKMATDVLNNGLSVTSFKDFNTDFGTAITSAAGAKVGWHGFRRGLASNLNRLGIDDSVIQAVLRHSDVATTQRCYIKTVSSDAVEAMRKFEDSLTESPSIQ